MSRTVTGRRVSDTETYQEAKEHLHKQNLHVTAARSHPRKAQNGQTPIVPRAALPKGFRPKMSASAIILIVILILILILILIVIRIVIARRRGARNKRAPTSPEFPLSHSRDAFLKKDKLPQSPERFEWHFLECSI